MNDTSTRVKLIIKSKDNEKRFKRIIESMDGFTVDDDSRLKRFPLLIYELETVSPDELTIIKSLLTSGTYGEVFLTARQFNTELLMQIMRMGVKEVFGHPLREKEIRDALFSFQKRKNEPGMRKQEKYGRTIYTMGTKGGVGTTTVAVNTAIMIAEKDKELSVVLVDMNGMFGDMSLFLSLQPSFGWGEILRDMSRVDETFLLNILTQHDSGVYLLSSPGVLNVRTNVTPETMKHVLDLMRKTFDYIVIDGGESLDDTSIEILKNADLVLLATTSRLPDLSNTRKLLDSLKLIDHSSIDKVRIVVNRYLKNDDISLKDAEKALSHKVFWTIPNDYKTAMTSINQGKPLARIAPRAPIVKSFIGLTDALVSNQKKKNITTDNKKGRSIFRIM